MELRERIVAHSMEMFVRQGLKGVRMDDIASELGISKRTLYEQFADKEQLIEESVRNFFIDRHRCSMELASEASNVIENLILRLGAADDVIRQSMTMASELRKFYPKIYRHIMDESVEKGQRDIREVIETGVREGLFLDGIGSDFTVRFFTDFMQTIHVRATSLPYSRVMIESVRLCILLLVRGISTIKGVEMIDKYLTENKQSEN